MNSKNYIPWVEKYRPINFDNIVLDKDTDHGLSALTNPPIEQEPVKQEPVEQEPTCENMCETVDEEDELDVGV